MALAPSLELMAGAAILLLWGVLLFMMAPHTGLIQILLVLGVVLLIRGIARFSITGVQTTTPPS